MGHYREYAHEIQGSEDFEYYVSILTIISGAKLYFVSALTLTADLLFYRLIFLAAAVKGLGTRMNIGLGHLLDNSRDST
jgi:hypothetical protein